MVKLRARYDRNAVPLIIATAMDYGSIRATAFAAGANDFVTKPIDMAALLVRIDALLEHQAAASPHTTA